MDPPLTIRPAILAEYESLSALWKGVDDLHYQALPQIFRDPDEWPSARSLLASLIAGPDSTILIAEADNAIAGFVALKVYSINLEQASRMRARRFVIVENMAVDPVRRRRGIGSALLRAAEEWAARRGIADLQLFVWEFNDAAARFYQSEGYATVHRMMSRRIAS